MVHRWSLSITRPPVSRPNKMSQARHWCFTYNNPTETAEEMIAAFTSKAKIKYLVFQKEKGGEEEENAGTIHYQGYVEFFGSAKRLAALKKIHNSIHWEPKKGNRDEARRYCMEPYTRIDGPWEYGTYNEKRGKRTDIDALYKLARTKETLLEVAEAMPGAYLRHYKAVQHVRQIEAFDKPKRSDPLQVVLFYGPPGIGKTRLAYDEAPGLYAIPLGKDLWFDGYRGEKEVLIDDFSGNLRLVDTLRMLDRYPIQVPIKGGHVWWCPTKIYLTSNVHPRNWYDYTKRKDSYSALTRRFHRVVFFTEDKEPQEFVGDEVANFFNSFDY